MKYQCTTESGSVYVFERDEVTGEVALLGEDSANVPKMYSKPVPPRRAPVMFRSSWPPQEGQRLYYLCKYVSQPDHPDRLPGGGKHTSVVVKVEVIP